MLDLATTFENEGTSPFHEEIVSNSLSASINTFVKFPDQKMIFFEWVTLQLACELWERSLLVLYLQTMSRHQTCWGANSHVLPLGGPTNIKRGGPQSWYFLSLPVSAAVYINSKSKRGNGGIKAQLPPKDKKELRCEGRDGRMTGVEIKKERRKDERVTWGRNSASSLPNAWLLWQRDMWGMAHHSQFLGSNQVMNQRYHLEWS